MVTLHRLNFDETQELHRRLGRRWRNAPNYPTACRRYRIMCRVFIAAAKLQLAWENARQQELFTHRAHTPQHHRTIT